MWEQWDQKLADLEKEMSSCHKKIKGEDLLWEQKIKNKKNTNANLKGLFDRQIEMLSGFESTQMQPSKKERAFFHWVKIYSQKLSEQMQELLKVMHVDFWIRMVYARVVHGGIEKNMSPGAIALSVQSQLKLLKKNERLFATKLEKLKEEDSELSKSYRKVVVAKANKDALYAAQNQKVNHLKQMASQIELKAAAASKNFHWSADVLVNKGKGKFFTEKKQKDEAQLFSSQSLLASFDVEDLTHNL